MKIVYNKNDNASGQSANENETRFSSLIGRLDSKDRNLDPGKRKRKWMYILAGLFFLYLASFLVPTPELSHQPLEPVHPAVSKDAVPSGNPDSQKSMTFEMPVDSFETLLKKQLHEKFPEKK
jgi:hypothetical protein